MTERDIDIIGRLKNRARHMGALLLIGGTAIASLVIATGYVRGKAVMLAVLGLIGVVVGLYKLVRPPIYLRRPAEIDRIDPQADTDPASIQVVMTDGMAILVNPVVATRDGVVQAIKAYRAEAKQRGEQATGAPR
jgi:hypothetical protein